MGLEPIGRLPPSLSTLDFLIHKQFNIILKEEFQPPLIDYIAQCDSRSFPIFLQSAARIRSGVSAHLSRRWITICCIPLSISVTVLHVSPTHCLFRLKASSSSGMGFTTLTMSNPFLGTRSNISATERLRSKGLILQYSAHSDVLIDNCS